MANASKDENNVNTVIGVLNTNGSTIVRLKADATSHGMRIDDNTTGSNNGPTHALKDENEVSTIMAVSSSDGITPVPLYITSDGKLLINSN